MTGKKVRSKCFSASGFGAEALTTNLSELMKKTTSEQDARTTNQFFVPPKKSRFLLLQPD